MPKAGNYPRAESHPRWGGDGVGYHGMQTWVKKTLGRPSRCEACGTEAVRRYEWVSRSGERKRDPADWMRLCVPCHRKLRPQPSWNKGRKTGVVPRSAYKKGQRSSPATEF